MTTTKPCPTCYKDIHVVERYPMYICSDCVSLGKTKENRPIEFRNVDIGGGFIAVVDGILVDADECYVNDELCKAQEGRYGGIVVSVVVN